MEQWLGPLHPYWPAMQENGFDSFEVLAALTAPQLEDMYQLIEMTKVGHQFYLRNKIAQLRGEVAVPAGPAPSISSKDLRRQGSNVSSVPSNLSSTTSRRTVSIAGSPHAPPTYPQRSSAYALASNGPQRGLNEEPSLHVGRELGIDYTPEVAPIRLPAMEGQLADPKEVSHGEGNDGTPSSSQTQNRRTSGIGVGYAELGQRAAQAPMSNDQRTRKAVGSTAVAASPVQSGRAVVPIATPPSNCIVESVESNPHSALSPLHNAEPYRKLLQMLRETPNPGGGVSPVSARRASSPVTTSTIMPRKSNTRLFLQ